MVPVPFYRPRNPRATPLWKLAETLYERLRREWEARFEARDLSRAAWETVRAMMAEAAGDPGVRPGIVVVPQTFGS